MPVINLGQFGPQRPSMLNGLSEALAQGIQIGTNIQEVKAKKAALDLQIKEHETKVEKERRQAIKEQLTGLSAKNYEDPIAVQTYLDTDQGKALKKEAEKLNYGYAWTTDKDGKSIFKGIPTKEAKDTIKNMQEQQMKAIEEKYKMNDPKNPVTPAESTFYVTHQRGAGDLIADIFTNPKIKDKKAAVQRVIEDYSTGVANAYAGKQAPPAEKDWMQSLFDGLASIRKNQGQQAPQQQLPQPVQPPTPVAQGLSTYQATTQKTDPLSLAQQILARRKANQNG